MSKHSEWADLEQARRDAAEDYRAVAYVPVKVTNANRAEQYARMTASTKAYQAFADAARALEDFQHAHGIHG